MINFYAGCFFLVIFKVIWFSSFPLCDWSKISLELFLIQPLFLLFFKVCLVAKLLYLAKNWIWCPFSSDRLVIFDYYNNYTRQKGKWIEARNFLILFVQKQHLNITVPWRHAELFYSSSSWSLIHFVATHFSPLITGQLPCNDVCQSIQTHISIKRNQQVRYNSRR